MRVAFLGVGHWHTKFYLDPCLALPWVSLVGVTDPDPARAVPMAARAGCPAFADDAALLAAARPDFVFVLGRHCDMAASVRRLIAARVPFAVEKPAGLTAAEVAGLARDAGSLFAAVPLVFRDSALHRAIARPVRMASFRFIGGPVSRYLAEECGWMLRQAEAGGGALLNLGIHFLDLCLALCPEARVIGATRARFTPGCEVEEYANVLLEAGEARLAVETGYLFPAPHSVFDLRYSLRDAERYYSVSSPDALDITDLAGHRRTVPMPTINAPMYPGFVADVLARAAAGRAPVVGLAALARALALVEAAYALAPITPSARSAAISAGENPASAST
ncbi:MAG: Gfo/Idh/MocA family protein [Acetobacteraceae bacterium]